MFDFHEKRRIRRYIYSKPVIGLIFLLSAVLTFSVYDRYVVSKEMQEKLGAKRTELKEIEMRAQALEAKVKYLSDERGIEEELRSRFDVAKEGEEVVILLDAKRGKDTPSSSDQEGVTTANEKKKSFWQELFSIE